MMKQTPRGRLWLMTFMQLLFLNPRGSVCVCVCLHVYNNHTNVSSILGDCVCIVESPPPSLVVSFPLSSTAASVKSSSYFMSPTCCLLNLLQLVLHFLLSQNSAENFLTPQISFLSSPYLCLETE